MTPLLWPFSTAMGRDGAGMPRSWLRRWSGRLSATLERSLQSPSSSSTALLRAPDTSERLS